MDKIILDDTSNQNRTDAFYLEGRRYTNLTILVRKRQTNLLLILKLNLNCLPPSPGGRAAKEGEVCLSFMLPHLKRVIMSVLFIYYFSFLFT